MEMQIHSVTVSDKLIPSAELILLITDNSCKSKDKGDDGNEQMNTSRLSPTVESKLIGYHTAKPRLF